MKEKRGLGTKEPSKKKSASPRVKATDTRVGADKKSTKPTKATLNEKKVLSKSLKKDTGKGLKKQAVRKPKGAKPKPKLKIYSLGGLNEIGKNMTAFECGNDIIIVDCGIGFPNDDMLGVDLVIPDFTHIQNNIEKVRGIFLTHGHEDHIGSLPYFLKNMNVPVYGTRLTLGILENKLAEHKLLQNAKLHNVNVGDTVTAGCFNVSISRRVM